jgi:hypothetical protein
MIPFDVVAVIDLNTLPRSEGSNNDLTGTLAALTNCKQLEEL